jgi:hypothetical protein
LGGDEFNFLVRFNEEVAEAFRGERRLPISLKG